MGWTAVLLKRIGCMKSDSKTRCEDAFWDKPATLTHIHIDFHRQLSTVTARYVSQISSVLLIIYLISTLIDGTLSR